MTHINAARALLPEGWIAIERDYDFCAGIISPDGKEFVFDGGCVVRFSKTKANIEKVLSEYEPKNA